MSALIRADWSGVTLAEFDALALIRHPDGEALLNAAWDRMHELNPFREGESTRLHDAGRHWWIGLNETCNNTLDEHVLIASAREAVSCLGLLTIVNAARLMRSAPTRR